MSKYLNKYGIIILSILLADLLSLYALNVLNHFRAGNHPYRSAAITMSVAVGIFFPMLKFLEKFLKKFSGKILKHGTKVAGNQIIGQLLGLLFAILVLWIGYAHAIYDVNLLNDARSWLRDSIQKI